MNARHSSLCIGLTGGIGSGKSTVAQILANMGAYVIDADAIARRATEAEGAAMPAIADRFGAEFVNTQGALDRERMRAHVFTHASAKQDLEAIIHPLVGQVLQEESHAALAAGHACLVYDVPLLVESGERWRRQVDWVCVVDCEVETQIQRVMHRNQLSRAEIERIISQQASRQQRLDCADAVIFNEGIDLAQLKQLVHEMMARFGL